MKYETGIFDYDYPRVEYVGLFRAVESEHTTMTKFCETLGFYVDLMANNVTMLKDNR